MIGKFIFVICACDVMAFWGHYEKPVEVVMLARSRAEKDITRTKIINDVNCKYLYRTQKHIYVTPLHIYIRGLLILVTNI